ncbi:MAG: calcium-binding protein [Lyngbya sp.]|nr:calcium-binding protein [Lyngbya sp.]
MTSTLGTFLADNLTGDSLSNTIFGLAGNDNLSGFTGDDTMNGNQGMDTLSGDGGNDVLFGGQDDDSIYGGFDFLDSIGGGNDLLFGNLGNDFLLGEQGNDSVFGGQGDDNISGGLGNDLVSGDVGNDGVFGVDILALNPGSGEVDTLTGGVGSDFFFIGDDLINYYTGAGNDDYALITDFNQLEFDAIIVHINDTYSLNNLTLPNAVTGTGIFLTTGGQNELIGFVQGIDASSLNFSLDFVRI